MMLIPSAKSPGDFPNGKLPFYVVVVFSVKHINHEGDERSRSHPGHGYSAYTEDIVIPILYVHPTKEGVSSHLEYLYSRKPDRDDVLVMLVNDRLKPSHKVELGRFSG